MDNHSIRIHNTDIEPLTHDMQRVITLDMMDQIHERPKGTARRTFTQHKSKMIEGKHYFGRLASEAKELGFTAPNGLILLTEKGYLMLVKSFRDKLAWQVQEQLVDGYFRVSHVPVVKDPNIQMIIDLAIRQDQLQQRQALIEAHAKEIEEKANQAIRGQSWITIRQYVAVHQLTRQLPPGKAQQQYGKFLVGHCQSKGLPVYKLRSTEGWEENTYPIWVIQETFPEWVRRQTRQVSMRELS